MVIGLDKTTGNIKIGPDIISRGFVYVRVSEDLITDSKEVVIKALDKCNDKNIREWANIKSTVKGALRDYIYFQTKRRPMILPIIIEV